MKNKKARLWLRTVILTVFIVAVAYTLFQTFNKDHEVVAEGDMAPVFQLNNLDGEVVALKDLRGKGVMLNFWGSWCGPCKDEMPDMNAVHKQNLKGVEIIAVNIGESPYIVNNFVNRYDLKFPIWLDRDKNITDAYSVDNIPTTFLIDEHGEIVKKIVGPMPNPEFIKKQLKLIQPEDA